MKGGRGVPDQNRLKPVLVEQLGEFVKNRGRVHDDQYGLHGRY